MVLKIETGENYKVEFTIGRASTNGVMDLPAATDPVKVECNSTEYIYTTTIRPFNGCVISDIDLYCNYVVYDSKGWTASENEFARLDTVKTNYYGTVTEGFDLSKYEIFDDTDDYTIWYSVRDVDCTNWVKIGNVAYDAMEFYVQNKTDKRISIDISDITGDEWGNITGDKEAYGVFGYAISKG